MKSGHRQRESPKEAQLPPLQRKWIPSKEKRRFSKRVPRVEIAIGVLLCKNQLFWGLLKWKAKRGTQPVESNEVAVKTNWRAKFLPTKGGIVNAKTVPTSNDSVCGAVSKIWITPQEINSELHMVEVRRHPLDGGSPFEISLISQSNASIHRISLYRSLPIMTGI
jgi:hypothetical protein